MESITSSGIYEIVNTVNGHRYVGSAVNIGERWIKHKSDLQKNKHHSQYLQNAWNKYGEACFEFRVIEHCFIFILIPREQHYMDAFKPEYNIALVAGSSLGTKRTQETKDKLSAIKKGNKNCLGRKYTPETIAKMSKARLGKSGYKHTPEMKAHISKTLIGNKYALGYKHSKEANDKLSARATGKKYSLGYKHTPEAIARMSELAKERWADSGFRGKMTGKLKKYYCENPEARAKMSIAQKKRYQEETPEARTRQAEAIKAGWARRREQQAERQKAG